MDDFEATFKRILWARVVKERKLKKLAESKEPPMDLGNTQAGKSQDQSTAPDRSERRPTRKRGRIGV